MNAEDWAVRYATRIGNDRHGYVDIEVASDSLSLVVRRADYDDGEQVVALRVRHGKLVVMRHPMECSEDITYVPRYAAPVPTSETSPHFEAAYTRRTPGVCESAARVRAAEKIFWEYDFGPDIIDALGSWQWLGEGRYSRAVFFRNPEGGGNLPGRFHVEFYPDGTPVTTVRGAPSLKATE